MDTKGNGGSYLCLWLGIVPILPCPGLHPDLSLSWNSHLVMLVLFSVSLSFESSGNYYRNSQVSRVEFSIWAMPWEFWDGHGESQVLKSWARTSGFSQGLDFLRSVD